MKTLNPIPENFSVIKTNTEITEGKISKLKKIGAKVIYRYKNYHPEADESVYTYIISGLALKRIHRII